MANKSLICSKLRACFEPVHLDLPRISVAPPTTAGTHHRSGESDSQTPTSKSNGNKKCFFFHPRMLCFIPWLIELLNLYDTTIYHNDTPKFNAFDTFPDCFTALFGPEIFKSHPSNLEHQYSR